MAFSGATNVKLGAITSSLCSTPQSNKEMCKATVPFMQATAYLVPTYLANSSSNFVTCGPTEDTQPSVTASVTYFNSFPLRFGILNGRNFSTLFKDIFSS